MSTTSDEETITPGILSRRQRFVARLRAKLRSLFHFHKTPTESQSQDSEVNNIVEESGVSEISDLVQDSEPGRGDVALEPHALPVEAHAPVDNVHGDDEDDWIDTHM